MGCIEVWGTKFHLRSIDSLRRHFQSNTSIAGAITPSIDIYIYYLISLQNCVDKHPLKLIKSFEGWRLKQWKNSIGTIGSHKVSEKEIIKPLKDWHWGQRKDSIKSLQTSYVLSDCDITDMTHDPWHNYVRGEKQSWMKITWLTVS